MFASSRHRCVPKMASPEARTFFSKKTYYSAIQRDGPTGGTRGGEGVRSKPRITKLLLQSLASESFISVLARHRCVPQIASPEPPKSDSTTPPQRQVGASPGAEPSAGRRGGEGEGEKERSG